MVRDIEIEQLQNLASKWETGDRNAGNQFVKRTMPLIKHCIKNMQYQRFQSRVDTEDLTQIVLEKLIGIASRNRLASQVTHAFYAWLQKFVTFTVLKEIRNHCAKKRDWRRQTNLETALTKPARSFQRESELKLVVKEVLESLGPKDKQLVECLVCENSQTEIAEILNIHPRTVRRRIAALRQPFSQHVMKQSNN